MNKVFSPCFLRQPKRKSEGLSLVNKRREQKEIRWKKQAEGNYTRLYRHRKAFDFECNGKAKQGFK